MKIQTIINLEADTTAAEAIPGDEININELADNLTGVAESYGYKGLNPNGLVYWFTQRIWDQGWDVTYTDHGTIIITPDNN